MTTGKKGKALKALQVSFRVTEAFKSSLQALSERQDRSQANMLDVILKDYLTRNPLNVNVTVGKATKTKATNKKATKKKAAKKR